MRPRHLRWILLAILAVILLLAGLGFLLDSDPLLIACLVCMVAGLIFMAIFSRCPYCHHYLRYYTGDYCPFCGENMNDPE